MKVMVMVVVVVVVNEGDDEFRWEVIKSMLGFKLIRLVV